MTDEAAFLAAMDAELEAEVGPEMAAKIRALSEANRAVLAEHTAWCDRQVERIRQRADELAPAVEAAMRAAMEAEWT